MDLNPLAFVCIVALDVGIGIAVSFFYFWFTEGD
jgi:hypothetical protein